MYRIHDGKHLLKFLLIFLLTIEKKRSSLLNFNVTFSIFGKLNKYLLITYQLELLEKNFFLYNFRARRRLLYAAHM